MLTIQFPEGSLFSHFHLEKKTSKANPNKQAFPDPTNVVALSIAASVASKHVRLKEVPEMVKWDGMG